MSNFAVQSDLKKHLERAMKNSKMQFAVLLLSTLCLLTGTYGQITGVTAGTDLTGGGTSGNVTLNLNTAAVPRLATANTFTANQTVNGNLTATGSVTGSGFDIGGEPIAFGSYSLANSFLGFAGNSTMTGNYNAAVGALALYYNTTGGGNTAVGTLALYYNTTGGVNTATGNGVLSDNTTGDYNTASGGGALQTNTTGSYNTASGEASGYTVDSSYITGSFNTFLGFGSSLTTGTFSNATAIGSNAVVSESNALVLGSFAASPMCKLNGCSNTNVGIGTSAPGHLLDVAGTVAFDSTGLNNGTNFIDLTFGLNAGEGMSSSRTTGPNQYGIDLFTDFTRRISIEQHGNVGIGTTTPDSLLTVNGSADKPGGGSWGTYSDGRLKNLNGSFSSGLSQILRINPIRYRYKSDNALGIRDTDEHIGVVAQDVQQVIPEAVTENSKGYLLVNNDPIIWTMLNAIKEQQEEIRALKSDLQATRQSLQRVQTQVARTQPALVAAK
jgi:trimeric autotransporter adhesin